MSLGEKERPAGIAVLAILMGLSGIISILFGVAAPIVIGWIFGSESFGLISLDPKMVASLGALLLIVLVLVGIISLINAWGLWALKGWARKSAIVAAIVGLFAFPIGTIISIILLLYLFSSKVKEAFT